MLLSVLLNFLKSSTSTVGEMVSMSSDKWEMHGNKMRGGDLRAAHAALNKPSISST